MGILKLKYFAQLIVVVKLVLPPSIRVPRGSYLLAHRRVIRIPAPCLILVSSHLEDWRGGILSLDYFRPFYFLFINEGGRG